MKQKAMVVADLMTPFPVTASPSTTVSEADEEMVGADIRHLPVVDEQGRVVGVTSDRDLLPYLRDARGQALALSKVMSEDVMTVKPETPAREASAILLDEKIGSLVVVDGRGHLCGMLTETDFLRLAHEALGGDALAIDDLS